MTTVAITYDGTDITDKVVTSSATFSSQVNGAPGTCAFKIRDDSNSMVFVPGKPLGLEVGGAPVWTGYVASARRTFFFDAENTSNPIIRGFLIEGFDINILFRKRFVFGQSDPTESGPMYNTIPTADTTAISDLVTDWLDLSDDDLDVSSLVENVGDINIDQPSAPIKAGEPWGDSMRRIDALTNAIFYIDPERNLVHTDVDTPDAPYDLSDQPSGGSVGYREMEIVHDGTGLINDALVWGTGIGSDHLVIAREEDATSISAHGRWQYAELNGSMYKQGTVNKRADTIVNGSPLSKRGAKNDRISVVCTVFQDGFVPAQKAHFFSNVFGYDDTLPIRRIDYSFANPTALRYRLYLSHEIDAPWNFFDNYFYDYQLPPLPGIPGLPGFPGLPGDCECGVTDSFSRTDPSGWGMADVGIAWSGGDDVTDGEGHLAVTSNSSGSLDSGGGGYSDYTVRARTSGATGDNGFYFGGDANGPANFVECDFLGNGTFRMVDSDSGDNVSTSMGFTPNTPFSIRFIVTDPHTVDGYCWKQTDPEPLTPTLTLSTTDTVDGLYDVFVGGSVGTGSSFDVYVSNIDIDGWDICGPVQFDNFERTTIPIQVWGNATPSGFHWENAGPGGYTQKIVEDGYGKIEQGTGFVGGQTGMSMFGFPDVGTGYWRETTFSVYTRLKIEAASSGSEAITGFYFDQTESPFGRTGWALVKNTGGGSASEIQLFRSSVAGGNTESTSTTLNVGAHYRVRYERTGTSHRVRIWADGTSEPSAWTLEDGGITWVGANDFNIIQQRDSSSSLEWKIWYDFIDFDYADRPCYDDVPPTPPSNSSGAVICEQQRTGGTVIHTDSAYVPGSVQLTVNGIRYSRGADYTEDPPGKLVTLDESIDPGSYVTICYEVSNT